MASLGSSSIEFKVEHTITEVITVNGVVDYRKVWTLDELVEHIKETIAIEMSHD